MTYPLPQPNTFSRCFETYRNLVLEKGFLAFWEAEHELKLLLFFALTAKTDLLCMLQGIYLVCKPKPVRNQYMQNFYLFQKLMILFSGIWIPEEVSFQKHNPVGPRKMIWEFSGYSRDKQRVIFQWKVEKSTEGRLKRATRSEAGTTYPILSAVNSMLFFLSFQFFVMTLYFLE